MKRRLFVLILALALLAPSAAHAAVPARTLGPAPVQADCLTVQNRQCYYAIGYITYGLDKHIVAVGDTVTANATYQETGYGWTWAGAPAGTTVVDCTPAGHTASGTCKYKATSPTNGWAAGSRPGSPANCCWGAAIYWPVSLGYYVAGDYIAVINDAAIDGHVKDDDGQPIQNARITIVGKENDGTAVDVYTDTDDTGEYNALLAKGTYTVSGNSQDGKPLCLVEIKTYCKSAKLSVNPSATVDFNQDRHAKIVGTIADKDGKPAQGVKIDVTGADTATGLTGKDGKYKVTLDKGGDYTVTPSKTKLKFAPESKNVSVQIGEQATADFQSRECEIDKTLVGWKIKAPCVEKDKVKDGLKDYQLTAPPSLGSFKTDKAPALPLKKSDELVLPVVLPDINLSAGGVTLTAFQNAVDETSLQSGQASLDVPGVGTGAAYDLTLDQSGSGSASALDLSMFDDRLSLSAEDVAFNSSGVSAGSFEVGLPPLLGGGAVKGHNAQIGAGGVSGTLDGATLHVGDLTVDFSGAQLTPNGFQVADASLTLPAYITGSNGQPAKLAVKNLVYDAKTGSLSVESAQGRVSLALAGDRVKLDADVNLSFPPGTTPPADSTPQTVKFALDGSGTLVVNGPGGKLFEATAALKLASLDCPVGGPCTNGKLVDKADLSITTATPVPVGSTGVGIKGLQGHVLANQDASAFRDEAGVIHGVTYTFSLGATLVTLPNQSVFEGTIVGSLSTKGNFGVKVDGTALGYVKLKGGACMLLFVDAPRDDVCSAQNTGRGSYSSQPPGVYVDAHASAEFGRSFGGVSAHASLSGDAAGQFVVSGGSTYLNAQLSATASFGVEALFVGSANASGTLSGELGSFVTPAGQTRRGIRAGLHATLSGSLATGQSTSSSYDRTIFIDDSGQFEDEGVDAYQRVLGAGHSGGQHAGTVGFSTGRGDSGTVIGLAGPAKGTPQLTLNGPGGLRVQVSARRGAKAKLTVTRAGGGRATPAQVKGVIALKSAPGAVVLMLPKPPAGRWTAQVKGAGKLRFAAATNRPAPKLAVSSPGLRKVLRPTAAKPVATIGGTLRGASARTTVSVYAAGSCVKRGGALVPSAGGKLLARKVKVKAGKWSYKWNTASVAGGTYVPYVVVDGDGPLTRACSGGSIIVAAAPAQAARVVDATSTTALGPVIRPRAAAVPANWQQAASTSGACKYGVTLRSATPKAYLTHASDDDPGDGDTSGGPEQPNDPTGTLPVPKLVVEEGSQPCIGANIAAAITGTDPSTGAGAVTRSGDGYTTYPGGAAKQLHYSVMSKTAGYKSSSKENRKAACGGRPFAPGGKPGPIDPGNLAKSCDEYPFASTAEGGGNAIVRGVPVAEQNAQGGQLSGFYRVNAVALYDNDGLFTVCVSAAPC